MTKPPTGLVLRSSFFAFGATTAGTACWLLLFRAPEWHVVWRLNPEAHAAFQATGSWASVLMFSVAVACAVAAIGLWIRARWGYRLAIVILSVNTIAMLALPSFAMTCEL